MKSTDDMELDEFLAEYARRSAWQQRWLNTHPEARLYYAAKNRARKAAVDFSIERSDIVIPDKCPYLGITLTNIRGKGRLPTNLSLDRIDNTKGYCKGNIQIVSELANRMKQNATIEQLKAFARGVLELHA